MFGATSEARVRDITDLLKQKAPAIVLTDAELTQQAYHADLERFRDFRPDADRMLWPAPIGPRWKN